MNVLMSLYLAALFVALTPGVLVTLPKGGKKYTVIAVHAVLFLVVWHFTNKIVRRMAVESFQNNMNNGMNNNGMNNNGMNNNGMSNNGMNNSGMNNSGMEGFQKMPRASLAPKQTRSTMEAKDTRSTMTAKAPR
jgi:hypothetical protein